MQKIIITSLLCILSATGWANVVDTLTATSMGYTNGSVKTTGSMSISNGGNRGYAVFDIGARSIPAGATIVSVALYYNQTVTGSGSSVSDTVYTSVGDLSSHSAATLFNDCIGDSVFKGQSWGATTHAISIAGSQQAVRMVQNNLTGRLTLSWVAFSGSMTYNIPTSPSLIITYTCHAPTAVHASVSATRLCSGSVLTLTGTATGASTYLWSGPNGFSSTLLSPGGVTVTPLSAGIYTLTATSMCGASVTSASSSVAVPAPPVAISGPGAIISGSVVTFSDATVGGAWASNHTATMTVNSSTGVATGVATGVVTLSYTILGCPSATAAVKVESVPTAITGYKAACVGGTTYLYSAAGTGVWTSEDTTIATVAPATGVVTGVSTGIVNITYTNDFGSVSTPVVIRTSSAPIIGPTLVCTGTTISLSDATPYGSWSRNNTKVSVDTNGVVSGISAGTSIVTYTTGCGTRATTTITVSTSTAAITGGSSNLCSGATTSLSNATIGGVWSVSDPTIVSVNGSGVVTALTQGMITVSYTKSGCSAVKAITIKTPPTTITGKRVVCDGVADTLSNYAIMGTWTSSDPSIATIDPVSGIVTQVAETGSTTIGYTTGCGSSVSAVIGTGNTPSALSGTSVLCTGSSLSLSNTAPGGVWSSDAPGIATVSSSGTVTTLTPGLANISYTTGCGVPATLAVPVSSAPAAIAGVTETTCMGTTVTLTNAIPFGSWTSDDNTVATVDPVTGVLSTVSQGYTSLNYSTGCGDAVSTTTFVKMQPSPISGVSSICLGTSTTMSDTAAFGFWTSSDPTVAIVNPSTGEVSTVFGIGTGSTFIGYSTGCGVDVSKELVVNGGPDLITGGGNLCLGSSATLADATTGGTWSSSDNSIVSIDAATGVATASAPGSVSIGYSTGCGDDASLTLTVDQVPGSITGPANICTGSMNTYYNAVTGGTWAIDNLAVANVDVAGNVAAVSDGTATLSYTLTNACGTNTSVFGLTAAITGEWQGVNSDWSDPTNWPCGTIPDATTDVYISATAPFSPSITSNASVRGLTIEPGTSVDIASGNTLSISGDLSNDGIIEGEGSAAMSGTVSQMMFGKSTLTNLIISNSNGVTVNAGDSVYIKEELLLSNGNFNTKDALVLVSDSINSGRIGPVDTSASITGQVTIQQFIPGGRRAYRFWGHPFNSSINLTQIENCIDITGLNGAMNGFTHSGTNAPSCFWYHTNVGNSSMTSDPGWQPFTSCYGTPDTNMFKQYEGIRLFIRGRKGEGLDGLPYTPSATKVSMHGYVNTGDQYIVLHKSVNSDYNQVSNPYPSPVDISSALMKAKLRGLVTGSAFYLWNPYVGTAGAFEPILYGTPYRLGANTSFQVRAAYDSARLPFYESFKCASANEVMLRTTPLNIELAIYDGNDHPWDKLFVDFNQQATSSEDADLDATKAINPDLNFFSISADNKNMCIDARPYTEGMVIPLGLDSKFAQDFLIRAENVTVPANGKIYLHDKLLGKYMELTQGSEYHFTISEDAKTQGNNRFELTTAAPETETIATAAHLSMTLSPNPATDIVNISFAAAKAGSANINITDISGVSVYNSENGTVQSGAVSVPVATLAPGIYMVDVTVGDEHMVRKLIKE